MLGEHAVVGIDLHQIQPLGGGLLVGFAVDDETDDVLGVPAGIAELAGEPIEQFWVRGRLTLAAEVIEHVGNPFAEKLFPQAVDVVARGEGILLGGDPVG